MEPVISEPEVSVAKGTARGAQWPRHQEVTSMSVLAIFRWLGDPDSLLAKYDKELQHPVAREQPRRRIHACGRADDGMVIVDVWDSESDFQAMTNDPVFQRNLQESGTPEPDVLEVFKVHATIL
jgi:hypothetical protein